MKTNLEDVDIQTLTVAATTDTPNEMCMKQFARGMMQKRTIRKATQNVSCMMSRIITNNYVLTVI